MIRDLLNTALAGLIVFGTPALLMTAILMVTTKKMEK